MGCWSAGFSVYWLKLDACISISGWHFMAEKIILLLFLNKLHIFPLDHHILVFLWGVLLFQEFWCTHCPIERVKVMVGRWCSLVGSHHSLTNHRNNFHVLFTVMLCVMHLHAIQIIDDSWCLTAILMQSLVMLITFSPGAMVIAVTANHPPVI